MVVLESHSANSHVLSGASGGPIGPNQYLQPDCYPSSMPAMMDAKNSPLALLAQTCNQIGSDSASSKFENYSHSKRKTSVNIESTRCESDSNSNSSTGNIRPRSSGSNSSNSSKSTVIISSPGLTSDSREKLSPKINHKSRKSSKDSNSNCGKITPPPQSTTSTSEPQQKSPLKRPSPSQSYDHPSPTKIPRVVSPTSSPEITSNSQSNSQKSYKKEQSKSPHSSSEKTPEGEKQSKPLPPMDPQGANPIIRSGLEVLHGGSNGRLHSNPGIPMPPSLSALSGYPGGYGHPHEALLNPAYRQQFLGANPSHPFLSYPGGGGGATPFMNYTRVKNASGVESIQPVCKDPYCSGCAYSSPSMFPGGPPQQICPAGCAQCDHQKIPFPFSGFGYPPSYLAQHAALLQQQQQQAAVAAAYQQQEQMQNAQRPYVCNWMDPVCGKRFASPDELFAHLKTHPQYSAAAAQNNAQSSQDAAMMAAYAAHHQQQQQMLQNSLYASSGLFNPAMAAAMQRQLASAYSSSPSMSAYAAAANTPRGGAPPGGPIPAAGAYYPQGYPIYGQRVGPQVHHPTTSK